MTLNVLQGHFAYCVLFKFDFLYSSGAFDKILSDSASHCPYAAAELLVLWVFVNAYRQFYMSKCTDFAVIYSLYVTAMPMNK